MRGVNILFLFILLLQIVGCFNADIKFMNLNIFQHLNEELFNVPDFLYYLYIHANFIIYHHITDSE